MLFTLQDAATIREHYKNLIGTPITTGSRYVIDGLFICKPSDVNKAIDLLIINDFNDTYSLVKATNETAKEFSIYVYMDDGADIAYHELDKNLTQKGIAKIYQ